jgi:hypothetical protein
MFTKVLDCGLWLHNVVLGIAGNCSSRYAIAEVLTPWQFDIGVTFVVVGLYLNLGKYHID